MTRPLAELESLLRVPEYPLAAKYDVQWIVQNEMGAQSLWLAESLARKMALRPGMRVLDMGCGKAMTSIFLAKEFGVQVWAVDLRVDPSDNWQRAREAGVEHLVYPIRAEARSLPFGREFFDAIVSINAYQYFGTDELYFAQHYAPLARAGAQIGFIMPGLIRDYGDTIPAHIEVYRIPDILAWHTPAWWSRHFTKTGLVSVECAGTLDGDDGWRLWGRWQYAMDRVGLLKEDAGRYVTFVRLVLRKND